MTTTVKVTAHCAANVQVRITCTRHADVILQDGESHETVVYDDIAISVKEEPAPIAEVTTTVKVGGDGPQG